MNIKRILGVCALSLSLVGGAAFAQDKAAKQAEILKTTNTALERFYAKKPDLKAAVVVVRGRNNIRPAIIIHIGNGCIPYGR